ncbi:MAG: right-handed parallel beta-helix repeat-containing protein, partial [Chloroflexi bacterium]|nr:right-handed parallel beta-helix repeat-containing protein [Chloroflexota bacterium]
MSKDPRSMKKAWTKTGLASLSARVRLIVLILVVAWSLVGMAPYGASAAGTTYYVDKTNPSCSDSGSGTAAIPFCTISKGAAVALTAGDTVNVVAGTYAETVYPAANGTSVAPITFHAQTGVTVTGDAAGFGSAFAVSARSYVVIDGFNITQTKYKGIYVDSSNHITITNNHVTYAGINAGPDQHQQGIFVRNTTYSTISGNITDHNSCIGIRLINGSDYNLISNNISFDNTSSIAYPVVTISDAAGIEMTGSSHNTIVNNITYGNEDAGINLYVNSSAVGSTYNVVVGNLSYGNGDHGIDNNNSPYNTIVGNTVQGNGTTGINFEGDAGKGSHHATVANNISVANGLTPPTGSFGGNLRVDIASITGTTLDYDIVDLQGATVQVIWNDVSYATLAAFKAAVPTQEVHGLQANPLFVSPVTPVLRTSGLAYEGSTTTGDYHLTAGSPAIDSANSDAPNEATTDIEGSPRTDDPATADTGAGSRTFDDRGAYEFQASAQETITYSTAGTFTWTAPAGVTSVKVEVWGAGGAGANRSSTSGTGSGGGGGGGAYAIKNTLTVVPGTGYTVTVGAGGTSSPQVNGGDSWFSSAATVMAKGGASVAANSSTGASGGSDASSVGDTKYSGGGGANGSGTTYGGGGGSSAGTGATGATATNATGATAPTGGGNGGNGRSSSGGNGTSGSTPGGGGGGALRTSYMSGSFTGGTGATGKVTITYTTQPKASSATVTCEASTVVYGSSLNCTVTVTASSGTTSPLGNVAWTTDGTGTFTGSPCSLAGSGGSSSCSVSYAPGAVGTGSHKLTASYSGNASFLASSGDQTISVTQKPASVTPNAASKIYGDADPAFSGTLTGFLPTDGITATYTRAVGETVLGGPYAISATLGPADKLANYTVTYNTANFTINTKVASVTPDAASKTYGDADPILTGVLTGFLPADGVTAAYSRIAGETVLGGPYTISAVLSPAGVLSNYNVTYNTANFTINTKAVSVTPNTLHKTYGAADPTLTGTLTGFLPADGVTAAYSRVAGETVLGGPYTVSAVLSPAGVLSNYNVTYNTGSLIIDAKAASVTPSTLHKTYGAADPTLTGTLTGFLPADSVTAAYSRVAGETVLGGPYTVSAVLSPAGVLSNYNVTYNTGSLIIDTKAASVTPNAASKTYGGSDPAFSGTLTGFLPADNVTATYSRVAGENAGTYSISGALAPAGVLSNYAITYNTAVFTINQLALTVTAVTDSKFYDGTVVSSGVPTITVGALVPGDTATWTQTFNNKNVGTGKVLVPSGVINDGNSGHNYAVTYLTVSTGSIAKLSITVSAVTDSKVYDGTTASTLEPVITPALVGTDTEAFSQAFDTKNVGTNKTLTPFGSVSDGNGGGNYSVTFSPVSTGSISKLAITVTANTDIKTYDGTTASTVEPTIVPALAGTDTEGFSQVFDTRNVGTGKTLTPYGTVNDGNGGNNYVVTFVHVATGRINARAITVTATTDTKTYDGTNASNGTPSITSGALQDGDTAAWTQTFNNKNVGANKTLTPAGAINDGNGGLNYSVTFATALGTINAAPLSVTANNKTVIFGSPDPTFDYTVSGFIAPDTFTTVPTCAVVENPHTAAGTYTISCSGGNAGSNYSIAYHNGVFTVTAKIILTVTAPSATITYGDTVPAFTPGYSGFTGGDDASVLDTAPTCSAGAGPFTVIGGPYAVTCSGGFDDKYDFDYVNGVLTVGQKALSITASNGSKTYGDTKTFTGSEFTASGLVGSDTVTSVTLASSGAPATAAVGPYAITASGATGTGLGNYAITYHDGSLTVAAKALSITASNGTKTYGDTKTFAGTEFTANGLVNNDSVTSVTLASSGSVATANVGTYNIVPTNAVGTGLGNYTLSYANGTLTVDKAPLTVTAANKTKAFGAVDPAFTFTLTGLKNSETASVLD